MPSDVYVHIGVITNLSTGPTNWRYAKFSEHLHGRSTECRSARQRHGNK